MDPLTSLCLAITAVTNLEIARINGMTAAQREAYLQIGIDAGRVVEKGWQDLTTRFLNIFHPTSEAPSTTSAASGALVGTLPISDIQHLSASR